MLKRIDCPHSLPRPITSISAVAERRDERANEELSEKHTHTPHQKHTRANTRDQRRGGEVWLIHLYFIIMLCCAKPHKAFVSILLWVLTSCYLCPWCCPFVCAVVLVYRLLSFETNCLVEAVILITCGTYLLWIQHTTQASSSTSFLACNCQRLWSFKFHIHNKSTHTYN